MPILGFFKTKAERRQDRTLKVRQWVSEIRRAIKDVQKHETDYIAKARVANQKGFGDEFKLLKANIRRVRAMQRGLDRRILIIETAMQMQAEMESNKIFADSMNAISKSISGLFSVQDMAKVQANFEKAAMQAQSVEEMTQNFMESFISDMSGPDLEPGDGISDEELIRLILGGEKDNLLEELDAIDLQNSRR